MKMSNKILVTGATGTIGTAVVKALSNEKANFAAAVRNKATASEKLGADVELVTFDFEDPSTYEEATQGVDKVFLLGPPLVTNLDSILTPFIDFLKSKEIKRIVYVGSLGMDKMPELPFHVIISEKLKRDGFAYTILKPSFFAQNFKNYEAENILQRGIIFTPAGTGKVAFVDVNDIAQVVVKTFLEDGHSGKVYEITGPETLSYDDAASLLSEVLNKQIVYPNPSPTEYTEALKNAGAPDFIAPYMIAVYSLITNNEVNIMSTAVEELTGRKPTSLREVLERDFS